MEKIKYIDVDVSGEVKDLSLTVELIGMRKFIFRMKLVMLWFYVLKAISPVNVKIDLK